MKKIIGFVKFYMGMKTVTAAIPNRESRRAKRKNRGGF